MRLPRCLFLSSLQNAVIHCRRRHCPRPGRPAFRRNRCDRRSGSRALSRHRQSLPYLRAGAPTARPSKERGCGNVDSLHRKGTMPAMPILRKRKANSSISAVSHALSPQHVLASERTSFVERRLSCVLPAGSVVVAGTWPPTQSRKPSIDMIADSKGIRYPPHGFFPLLDDAGGIAFDTVGSAAVVLAAF